MINAFVTNYKDDGTAEVSCIIKGKSVDFAVEFEAITKSIVQNPELLRAANMAITKLMIEKDVLPDCFRPKSDSIDFINNIFKGEETND